MIWYFLFILIAITLVIMACILFYKINENRKNRKQSKLKNKWILYFDDVFKNKPNQQGMEAEDVKSLRSIEELMAFFAASATYHHSPQLEVREQYRQFIRKSKPSWIQLGQHYRKKSSVEKAYFAYICEQLQINDPEEYDELTEVILSFALEPSINSRENALKALYAFGNAKAVTDAYIRLSKLNRTHHRKLVTDGLLAFKGDQELLAQSLWDQFDHFSNPFQVAMIDYFRFSSSKPLAKELIKVLEHGNTDKEVSCAILRYYEKYPVQQYKETIMSYLNLDENDKNWECISTAATVLSQYPGEDTVQALKAVLSSKYWYIRLNAARSIAELGVEEEAVIDILEGQDFYAKEQLVYHMNSKRERRVRNG